MIPAIAQLFTDDILAKAAQRFGVTAEQVHSLGGFESHVFEYVREDKRYILKITHTFRRSAEYIMGELDWLRYLEEHGVSVAKAIPSIRGYWVEVIPAAGSQFLAYSFEKAAGTPLGAEHWNAALFQEWGRLTGQMHRLTHRYQVSNSAYRRMEWDEEDELDVAKHLPATEPIVIEKAYSWIEKIKAYDKPANAYGLVHNDLHTKNMYIHNGRLTAFDFDDCIYNFLVNDIAMALYYAIRRPLVKPADSGAFAREFLLRFMEGYSKEHDLSPIWIKRIPDFLMVRHILLYVIHLRLFNKSQLSESEQRVLAQYKQDIMHDYPVVDLDFASI